MTVDNKSEKDLIRERIQKAHWKSVMFARLIYTLRRPLRLKKGSKEWKRKTVELLTDIERLFVPYRTYNGSSTIASLLLRGRKNAKHNYKYLLQHNEVVRQEIRSPFLKKLLILPE